MAGALGPAQSLRGSCEDTDVSLRAEGAFNLDNQSHLQMTSLLIPMADTINTTNRKRIAWIDLILS